jgi:hypothetical protein
MKKVVALFLFGAIAFVAIASAKSKTSPELSQSNPQSAVHVIVGWNQIPGAQQHGKVTGRGGSLTHAYRNLKAGAYTMSAAAAMDLANDPDVAYVAVDRPVKPLLDYTTDAVNAAAAWSQKLDGTGIGVAVIPLSITRTSPENLGKGQTSARRPTPLMSSAMASMWRELLPAAEQVRSVALAREC